MRWPFSAAPGARCCAWRAATLNSLVGIAGLAVGILVGVQFLKHGYNLGRSGKTYPAVGWVMPVLMIGLLLLAIIKPAV